MNKLLALACLLLLFAACDNKSQSQGPAAVTAGTNTVQIATNGYFEGPVGATYDLVRLLAELDGNFVSARNINILTPKLLQNTASACELRTAPPNPPEIIGNSPGTCLIEASYTIDESDLQTVILRFNIAEGSTITGPAVIEKAPEITPDLVKEILIDETIFIADVLTELGLVNPTRWSFSIKEDTDFACVVVRNKPEVSVTSSGTCLIEIKWHFPGSPNQYVSYLRLNVADSDATPKTVVADPTFVPLVDFEWTAARKANEDFFNLVGAIETWELGYTGKGAVVAIIDGGFEVNHPDFTDRIILEVCLSSKYMDQKCPNGENIQEGTGVLKTPDNESGYHGTGVAGVVHQFAPDARFIFLEPQNSGGGRVGSTTLAYDWLLDNAERYGIDAVVMSYGSTVSQRESLISGEDCPDPYDENETFTALQKLGVVPIAASGNDGFLAGSGTPACYPDVASVGWANQYGLVHNASNVTENLTLLAPSGLQVAISEFEDRGLYDSFAGTSGAAPVVGALIAIARQIDPDATPNELIKLARSTAYSIDDVLVKDIRLVDFLAFSQTLSGGTVSPKKDISIKPNTVINLFVGEGVDLSSLCDLANFELDCGSKYGEQKVIVDGKPERLSGPASVCEVPTFPKSYYVGAIVGVSPGTCTFVLNLNSFTGPNTLSEDAVQNRIVQINVQQIDQSQVDSVIEVTTGTLLNQSSFISPDSGLLLRRLHLLTEESTSCAVIGEGNFKRELLATSPGTCFVKMESFFSIGSSPETRKFVNGDPRYIAINVTE